MIRRPLRFPLVELDYLGQIDHRHWNGSINIHANVAFFPPSP